MDAPRHFGEPDAKYNRWFSLPADVMSASVPDGKYTLKPWRHGDYFDLHEYVHASCRGAWINFTEEKAQS